MNRTATILLLFVAIALAVFVGTTQRWRFSPERVIQPGTALFQFEPDEISFIRIKNGDQSFRIQKNDGGWRLVQGIEDNASPEAVNALIKAALETVVLDRIDASELRDDKSLSAFGVLKSSLQIDFKGDKPPSLLIGKTSPDGTRQYVSFENSRTVYLIPKDMVHLITMPVENYRDRRLLGIDPAQVDRMVFSKGQSTLELARNASGWQIIRPLNAAADDSAVESLLAKISALRIQSFQLESKSEPSDPPRIDTGAEARFFTTGEDTPAIVRLDPPSANGSVAAHLDSRKIAGTVSANASALFSPDIDSLRDKSLLRLNLDFVDLIRVDTGGTQKEIHRTPEGWSDSSPEVPNISKTLAAAKVIARLPATPTELQKYGLVAPSRRITFYSVLSENTPETSAGTHPVASISIGTIQPDGRLPVLVDGTPEIRFVSETDLQSLP